jgi:hypothetical protein
MKDDLFLVALHPAVQDSSALFKGFGKAFENQQKNVKLTTGQQ